MQQYPAEYNKFIYHTDGKQGLADSQSDAEADKVPGRRVGNRKANPKFIVGDRRQAGNPGKQTLKAGQEQAGSVTGWQAGTKPTLE